MRLSLSLLAVSLLAAAGSASLGVSSARDSVTKRQQACTQDTDCGSLGACLPDGVCDDDIWQFCDGDICTTIARREESKIHELVSSKPKEKRQACTEDDQCGGGWNWCYEGQCQYIECDFCTKSKIKRDEPIATLPKPEVKRQACTEDDQCGGGWNWCYEGQCQYIECDFCTKKEKLKMRRSLVAIQRRNR